MPPLPNRKAPKVFEEVPSWPGGGGGGGGGEMADDSERPGGFSRSRSSQSVDTVFGRSRSDEGSVTSKDALPGAGKRLSVAAIQAFCF